ncbi:MAG: alkaline phosphatase family protein [Candidatus Lutacidiplasmatales archaeon]
MPNRSLRLGATGVAALSAVAVALLFLVPGAVSGSRLGGTPIRAASAASNDTPFIQHLVVVVLENEALASVYGHGPYERYLAATYGNASSMFAACHPSAPNYLAMVSGVVNQCGSDTWNNYTNTTLFTRIDRAGLTWGSFAENLPATACSNPGGVTSGLFATRHVPTLWFHSTLSNQSYCRSHVFGSDAFNDSVQAGSLRNFSFYTPNLCDDGHTGCGSNTSNAQLTAQADAWLRGWLGPMLNHTGVYASARERALIAHTAFLVTWDEASAGTNTGFGLPTITGGDNYKWCAKNGAAGDAVCGGPVYAAIVSPYSLHRTMTANDSTYGIPHTVEWLFHLAPLGNPGGYDNFHGFPAMSTLFNFTANS